jgi:Subtilase family/FG-GAP-like repeat
MQSTITKQLGIIAIALTLVITSSLLILSYRLNTKANSQSFNSILQKNEDKKLELQKYNEFKSKRDKDEIDFLHSSGEIILKLKDNSKEKIDFIEKKLNSKIEIKDLGNNTYLLKSENFKDDLSKDKKDLKNNKLDKNLKKVLQYLDSIEEVEYAELNGFSDKQAPFLPNDPYIPDQWVIKNTGQNTNTIPGVDLSLESAWNITQGNANIIIADIDAGWDLSHDDLSGKLVTGYDFADNDNDVNTPAQYKNTVDYPMFHANAVSGIIAAKTNEGYGMAGVCPQCKIMPLKVYSDTGITKINSNTSAYYAGWNASNVINSINYAINNGAKIINLELQGGAYSSTLQNAINNAVNNGLTVVSAAGNSNSNNITNAYPGAYNNVIAVAAVRGNNVKTNYSNYGSWIDVSVPVDFANNSGQDIGGSYAPTYKGFFYPKSFNGTSAATAYAAGALGLMYAKYPTQANHNFNENLLKQSSVNIDSSNSGLSGQLGSGRINMLNSLNKSPSALVWRNKITGENAIWNTNNTSLINGDFTTQVTDQNWDLKGSGDFNQDGKKDLVWRNKSTGENVVWYMQGARILSTAFFITVNDQNWDIKGVGDFNTDGKPDLVWRNKGNGENVVWYLNNSTITTTGSFITVNDQNWDIKGVGDFNTDGKPDLVWRNKGNGENVVWYLNNSTITTTGSFITVNDQNWDIKGVGDFNTDGKPDLVWRNKGNGENVVWYLNNTNITSSGNFMTLTDQNWDIKVVY